MSQPMAPPPPPGSPAAPAKKGLSPIAWIAIGCIGLILVAGIGFTAVAWWGAKKVGDYAKKWEDNPEMAAVEMIAAANPEIEIVDRDPDAGQVTLRNTKTNETITVDLADVREGRIKWNVDGKEGGIEVDSESGTVKMKGEDGEVVSQLGGGEVPEWIPVYPGTTPQQAFSAQDGETRTGNVGMTTTDSLDDAFAWYKEQLADQGYSVTESQYSSGADRGAMVAGEKEGRQISVTLSSAEGGGTQIGIFYSGPRG